MPQSTGRRKPRAFARASGQHARVTPPLLPLAICLALAGCAEAGPTSYPASWTLSAESIGEVLAANRGDDAAVRAQAAIDLRCASATAVTGSNPSAMHHSSSSGAAYHAAGCGQVITYVALSVHGDSSQVPGSAGKRVAVLLRRLVPVSREGADAALAALERAAASIAMPHEPPDRSVLAPWLELAQVASRNLACPRETLDVNIVNFVRAPSTYLAEGCGSRALFVRNGAGALVMTSRVALPAAK